jgi:hypothetical protein
MRHIIRSPAPAWHCWPMKHPALAIAALILTAWPALALSLTSTQVGEIYCDARLSGDMAPVLAILTPELTALVEQHLPAGVDAATGIPWQSSAEYADTCMPVGASGTAEQPEIVIAFGYRDAGKAQYADRLIMRFIDKRLRIDDIAYANSGTLRDKLAAR